MRRHVALVFTPKEITQGLEKIVVDQTIWLYTHWGAEGLEDVLAGALERGRERWDDDGYIARVIASDVFAGAGDDITGYGLTPFVTDDEYPTLFVDLVSMKVNNVPFEDFVKNPQMFAI